MLQEFDDNPPNNEDQPPPHPPKPVANAAAQQDVQLEILRLLQEMHLNYAAGRGYRCGRDGGGDKGGRGQGNRNKSRRTPENANLARHTTYQYCSTHGGCSHASQDCTRKAANHNDEATMENCLDGSNTCCPPIQV